ncbi:hypothetical protein M2451_000082 [Dysgonomonas sp. PFB1-18]|uniref:hypothetical protein n=1 Tax=unclassified Dysgonomonas TaxID=2630389 RepID=UPI002473E08F|nr:MULTISPECIES: hypothetical protein [unclassified Dysgonomonas]MDH6307633.1 hypothetical protein [Dysgonomonas sp. PF1-14]MDH6337551.1 hypothetical protein [Dysgonomonas sp. PF1-16]MDH6378775.1 hypothetical protein [Dysgonomonas sp. PFB1-18]MDH6399193.1 hypothetical protein [Dysgonomonas sp. PF1-23]
MKKILILIIGILFTDLSYSQIDFKDEPKSFKEKNKKWYNFGRRNKEINTEFKLKNDYDFELRLWTDPAPVLGPSVFVMQQKDNKWTAQYYAQAIRKEGDKYIPYWKKKDLDSEKLNELWAKLVENQVLTLPTQDSIRDRMRIYSTDTLAVFYPPNQLAGWPYYAPAILDGMIYRVELRTKKKKRTYTYHCPKGYLENCPNVEELYRAYAIIVLIRKYAGLNLSAIC